MLMFAPCAPSADKGLAERGYDLRPAQYLTRNELLHRLLKRSKHYLILLSDGEFLFGGHDCCGDLIRQLVYMHLPLNRLLWLSGLSDVSSFECASASRGAELSGVERLSRTAAHSDHCQDERRRRHAYPFSRCVRGSDEPEQRE